jgi:hypothetical protein
MKISQKFAINWGIPILGPQYCRLGDVPLTSHHLLNLLVTPKVTDPENRPVLVETSVPTFILGWYIPFIPQESPHQL